MTARLPSPYQLGDFVYHVAEEGPAGMIVGINFTLGGGVSYNVQWDRLSENTHYAPELRKDPVFGDPGKTNLTQPPNNNTKTL